MKAKIGIPPDMACLPLRRWLGRASSFELFTGPRADIAYKLRRRDLDAAFVSPLEYARESSEYRVLPGFALSSRSGIELHFHEGLKRITAIAANPADAAEIVLARIVLAEEFDTNPPIVPVQVTDLPAMLGKADAALLTGEELFAQEESDYHILDIAEAWSEMVDLPYVHGILCAREDSVTPEAVGELAVQDWVNIPATVSGTDIMGKETAARANTLLSHYSFSLTDEVEEGVVEYLRYAHYHGFIPDIPLFRLYQTDVEDDDQN
jgi:predicted solute-binding protein